MKKRLIFAIIAIIIAVVATCLQFGCFNRNEVGAEVIDRDVTLYKVGDNAVTITVKQSEIGERTANYEWSVEPTTLMYTEDGRQSWIWHSEIGKYEEMGWSVNPPVTIYGANGDTRVVLLERKQDYLDTGVWFSTYEEANPAVFTYYPFQKSNLTVEQLNKILAGTGLAGYGQSFYTMEQTYSVNALFCIAVGAHESANFYKTANWNNYFGFRGGRGWMSFSSPDACIMYFGQLMTTRLYYGKTIDQIAPIYCDGSWSGYVRSHMAEKWSKLSV